jgi:hypothetical protein
MDDYKSDLRLGDVLKQEELDYYRRGMVSAIKCLVILEPDKWPVDVLVTIEHRNAVALADRLFHILASDVDEIKKFQEYELAEQLHFLYSTFNQMLYQHVLLERAWFLYNRLTLESLNMAVLVVLADEEKQEFFSFMSRLAARQIKNIHALKVVLGEPPVSEAVRKGWENELVRNKVISYVQLMSATALEFVNSGDTIIRLGDAAVHAAYRAAEPELYKHMFDVTGDKIPKSLKTTSRDGAISWFVEEVTKILDVKSGRQPKWTKAELETLIVEAMTEIVNCSDGKGIKYETVTDKILELHPNEFLLTVYALKSLEAVS